ncbi:hypothetical protein LPB138_14085 [Urechidicola croceus]|uniref:Glycosyltransferase 2-like domain-containing protein n=1 Tax=Urechidicola croceus TaxID=1850246 RepID=A0A1D8PC02_9FLAO|nr:hypothetical protein LPB138_14085 [Urechidicola croceus]
MKDCISSIRNQSFKDYEVLIIDGNSTDGTIDFLNTLEKPFLWQSEDDFGVYDAMNKGIKLSKGKWLYFLGCDDRFYSNNTLKDIFSNRIENDVALMIGQVKYDLNEGDSFFVKKNDGVFASKLSRKLWLKNTLHHQAIFYKKELFSSLKYSLSYKVLSDYALNLSLFKKGVKGMVIEDKIAICGTNGISKNYQWKLYEEEIDIKTSQSSIFLRPVFFMLGLSKYLIKKRL